MTLHLHPRYTAFCVLILLSLPLFFINIQDHHGWGDDFALYLNGAMNLAHGIPLQHNTWIFNPGNTVYSPPSYPPGYSVLLWPVVSRVGISFRHLCYFNSFLYLLLMFVSYGWYRTYTGRTAAICMSVMTVYSGYMVSFKSEVLADVPCLLFIMLYLTIRESRRHIRYRYLLLIITAFAAIEIRSQAILLLPAEGLVWLVTVVSTIRQKKQGQLRNILRQPAVLVISITLLLHFIVSHVLVPATAGTTQFYFHIFRQALHQSSPSFLWEKLKDTIGIVTAMPWPGWYAAPASGIAAFIRAVLFWAILIPFIIRMVRRPSLADSFFALMLFMLLFYPCRDPRYFLPLFPVAAVYLYFTVRTLCIMLPRLHPATIAIPITIVYFMADYNTLLHAATAPISGGIMEQREKDAFGYISSHVAYADVILFTKPRALALFTGRRTVNLSWYLSPAADKPFLDSIGVKYVLTLQGFDDAAFINYMRAVAPPADSTIIGAGYTLYRLR